MFCRCNCREDDEPDNHDEAIVWTQSGKSLCDDLQKAFDTGNSAEFSIYLNRLKARVCDT